MLGRFVLPGVSRASPYHRPRTTAGEDRHGSLAPEQRDSPAAARRLEKRHYNNREAEFILEPLSPSVVQVTHREQVAYFGTNLNWDTLHPLCLDDLDRAAQGAGRPPGAQRIGVVDAVATGQRGGHQRHHLVAGVGSACSMAQVQVPVNQLGQAKVQVLSGLRGRDGPCPTTRPELRD